MDRHEKLLLKVLRAASDADIGFEDLCALLRYLGFEERTRGSHHIFRRAGVEEKPNLQREGSKAKVYQVRQIRNIIVKNGLGGSE